MTLALLLAQWAPAVYAQETSARDLVDRVDTLLWGKTLQGEFEMTIATPRWQRTRTLRAWMGSDFTNDDLVKQSSAVDDYTQRILRTEAIAGAAAYVIEVVPKPGAAVVWGKILYWVRKADFIPLTQEYCSERSELIRVLNYSDVRPLGGRTMPTKWEMRPRDKPWYF